MSRSGRTMHLDVSLTVLKKYLVDNDAPQVALWPPICGGGIWACAGAPSNWANFIKGMETTIRVYEACKHERGRVSI